MSKTGNLKEIQKYVISSHKDLEDLSLKDVQWKLAACSSDSVLFYKINNTSNLDKIVSDFNSCSASAIIVNKNLESISSIKKVIVVAEQDWLKVQKCVLDKFYPCDNSRRPLIIGVTGTNGKTTTVDVLRQVSCSLGKKAVSVGTLGIISCNGNVEETGLTSPPYIEIRKIINRYADYDAIFFEVSSHALDQERFYRIDFDAAGWTNISRDHLDYHGTEEKYFKAKRKIIDHLTEKGVLFVPEEEATLLERINSFKVKKTEHSFQLNQLSENQAHWLLGFQRKNLYLGLSILNHLWEMPLDILRNLSLRDVPGRSKVYKYKDARVLVDYAHTPDALENILKETKKNYPAAKLHVVFGCGGDRDRGKRIIMGEVANSIADEIYVTSDNPRFEDPQSIIDDILKGITKSCHVNTSRSLSIQGALQAIKDTEDVLVIAGKGHENYMDIKGVKHSYSDEEEILKVIK